jgi:hypothetical protein
MYMRRLFWLVLLTTPALARAQNITGIWQGHFRSSNISARSSGFDDRYKFEVQLAQNGKSLEGVTYSYLSTFFYGKATAAGTVNPLTQKVLLQEGKIIEFRNSFGDICIMTCFLQYTKSGEEEFMEGTYVSMDTRDSSNCGRGTVFLRKVPMSDFYTEPLVLRREKEIAEDSANEAKKLAIAKSANRPTLKNGTTVTLPPVGRSTAPSKTPSTVKTHAPAHPSAHPKVEPSEPPLHTAPMARVNVPSASLRTGDSSTGIGKKFPTIVPAVVKERENEVVKTLVIHTHEVTLNIYDDGAIDGDTVSVYLDNKQVINHAMLTDRPLTVTLHLDENNDYHEIVMVAENEGEIPPNTSLMIVKAGDKEYEVRISTTEQKNAVIKFQYAK